MKFLHLATLLLITLLVTSCRSETPIPDDPLADKSFSTGEPCAAPCWYNLVVGKTTEKEALEAVKQLPFIAPNVPLERTTVYESEDAKSIYFDCLSQSGTRSGCVNLVFSQNELKQILISVGYELTFKTVVDQLGPPDYVSYFVQPGEQIACDIYLLWQNLGIEVHHYQKQACPTQQQIDPDTRATGIFYYIPSDYPNSCGTCDRWLGFDE